MTNLGQRIITAATLVVLLICVLFLAPVYIAQAFFALALVIAGWEWSGFLSKPEPARRVAYVLVFAVLAALVLAGVRAGVNLHLLLYLSVAWWLAVTVWLLAGSGRANLKLAAPAGLICLVPACYALFWLLDAAAGAGLFVWVVLIVAAADIGAYFTGRALGRSKLAPHISPGKTREGLYGGLCCAALAGGAGAWYWGLQVTGWTGIALVLGLVSVSGDLLISSFKRSAGLKDSGKILPGHGGVLDRIDGLHAALPFFVLALQNSGWQGSNGTPVG